MPNIIKKGLRFNNITVNNTVAEMADEKKNKAKKKIKILKIWNWGLLKKLESEKVGELRKLRKTAVNKMKFIR
jgi:hypothetical protein